MTSKEKPLKGRPRAPTITVDTSALNEGEQPAPEITSPTSGLSSTPNNNTLAPPSSRARTDSTSSAGSSVPSETNSVINDEEALKPDPGHEEEFNVENNPFAFTPGHMGKLEAKTYPAFHAVGGLSGLERGLQTSIHHGLSQDEDKITDRISFETAVGSTSHSIPPTNDDIPSPDSEETVGGATGAFTDRQRVFGDNTLPEKKSKTFLQLAWMALQDKVLILLSIAAVVSLALGLYQTFGTTHEGGGAKVEWVEGVAIIVAITIVVLVGALNDWQKERQFVKLNRKKEDRLIKVIRSGRTVKIPIQKVFVGDVMLLEQGDIIPVDGIFISGHNVSCDESSATGESDIMKKTAADVVFKAMEEQKSLKKLDPFIISGAKVQEGFGKFLVTATGVNSSHGKTMLSLREDGEVTPLQLKLNVLAGYIAKLGSSAGLLLFIVLLIEFLARLPQNERNAQEKAQQFLEILIVSVTVIVVAVPEGLPLAVTLALAFATKRMTKDNNLVRHLQSCETMGNATVICSDKTGTLTQNVMTVVGGSLGASSMTFGDQHMENRLSALAKENADPSATSSPVEAPVDPEKAAESAEQPASDFEKANHRFMMYNLTEKVCEEAVSLMRESVAMNSTAYEGEENGKTAFIGSKTEVALLDWAQAYLKMTDLNLERHNNPTVQLFPFDSNSKCMAAVIKTKDGKFRMYLKGAPEIVLTRCVNIVENPAADISSIPITSQHQSEIKQEISTYASLSLRTMALSFREFEAWPPSNLPKKADGGDVEFKDVWDELTWIGVVGIQDPVRVGVPEAVKDCKRAGVNVKMVTGDNIETAKAIAKECGILQMGGEVMEGPAFRKLNDFERQRIVPTLSVLARSSPEDKQILVKTLRSLGNVVAVTGDGTNDAQALKAADVGFSMGIAGTEVAKEASDIILMDDNFSSIVKALAWGRTVNDAVKKFLQFQITVNITAVVLTFVTAVYAAAKKSNIETEEEQTAVLNAVQLLWVNLIMDTFAALALATDPPTSSLLDRKPEPRNKALIDLTMWKMIIGQSIFQLIATFVLYFAGPSFLGYPENEQKTLVFNVFVWMQIFNAVNCRRIDNKLNTLEAIYKNWLFLGILGIMIGGQTLIVFVGGAAFEVTELTGPQWGISIVIGLLAIPIGALIRFIPDRWLSIALHKCLPKFVIEHYSKEEKTPTEQDYLWASRAQAIHDDLSWFRKFHGGRLQELKYTIRHPKYMIERSRSRSGSRSPMHSAIAMSGSLAGSIGVGDMTPIEKERSTSSTGRQQDAAHAV